MTTRKNKTSPRAEEPKLAEMFDDSILCYKHYGFWCFSFQSQTCPQIANYIHTHTLAHSQNTYLNDNVNKNENIQICPTFRNEIHKFLATTIRVQFVSLRIITTVGWQMIVHRTTVSTTAQLGAEYNKLSIKHGNNLLLIFEKR